VEVPDYLRRALLGEDAVKELERGEDEEGAKPVLDTLISSRAKEISEMDESDLMKQVRSAYENFRSEMVRYECRVIDGSYKVTKRTEVEDVGLPKPSSHFVRGEQVEEDVAGPPRAKQDIQTVVSQSPLALILRRVVKCLWTKGQHMKEETKVIAEGINLHFEEGKMYLVLGLPGSGKSTVLKMIANTLHKDKSKYSVAIKWFRIHHSNTANFS
jgi:ABC-type glutathione transport system ATPase component